MVAATLMWIAESARLRASLAYCHLFGEIVHAQIALKYAFLKAMSHQFCCMVQALGKSPNQSPPSFKSLGTSEAFFTFIGPLLYLMWIYWKWRICSRLMWSLKSEIGLYWAYPANNWVFSGPTSYAVESSAWYCEKKGAILQVVETNCGRECNNLNKTWCNRKQLAQSEVRRRVGAVDALCFGWDQEILEEEEKYNLWDHFNWSPIGFYKKISTLI